MFVIVKGPTEAVHTQLTGCSLKDESLCILQYCRAYQPESVVTVLPLLISRFFFPHSWLQVTAVEYQRCNYSLCQKMETGDPYCQFNCYSG